MATNLPYPLSDNRSYTAAHSTRNQQDALYGHDDLQYGQGAAYKLSDHQRFYQSSSRTGPPLSQSLEGLHEGLSVYEPRGQVGETYSGSSDVQSHYSASSSTQPFTPAVEQSEYASYRIPRQLPAPSPSASSQSSPAIPDLLPPTTQTFQSIEALSPTSSVSAARRKEKPRIALALDQPLTSQGKARTRVYVACVQCRSRKIRCDGAKPICHNCSRRTGSSATSEPECLYDSAPKRRGPDRNPGARQRLTTGETTDGGKVRKRRRRQQEPSTDKGAVDNVNYPTKDGAADGSDQKTMRMDPIDVVDVAAQSHVPTRPTRLSVLVEDLDAYTEPSRDTAYSLGSSSGSSHNPVSPSHYPPPRQEPIGHRPDPLIVTPSQDIAQFAQAPLYYKSAESVLTYVGHVPSAVISAPSDEYGYENDKNERKPQIGAEPSLQFTRDTWWDALLSFYSGRSYGRAANSTTLTSAERDSTVQQVLTDLQQLFRASNYWFSFLNVSRFFTRLLDPLQRQRMQPSLVLGALAVSVFMHSSEREGGQKGRAWAMRLRDEAQSALEASVSTRSIDASLVHAAWLISFFEICAHPYHSSNRVQSTFAMLDSLIRTLSLTQVDKEDARVTTFASQLVPIVSSAPHTGPHLSHWDASTSQLHAEETASPCTCASYTLGHINPMAQQVTPLWLTTPAWGANWSEAEITKEECRRVVWSSMMLSAGHSSYTAANGSFSQMDLFINNPSNYAVFFPGESTMAPGASSKESIWALYMRAMLLWHSCIRMRRQTFDGDKAHFAVNAWLEVDKIEEGLNSHTCNIERAYLFQGREYLFNCRMCISHEFSRYIPQATANANLLFHRKRAEEWLTHQAWVAKQLVNGLQTVTGQPNVSIGKRPFFVFWFMSQIRRALTLWSCDQSLLVALDVSRALMGPTEFLMSLWPCPEQRKRYHELIDALANACAVAGLPPPQMYSPLTVTRPVPQ